MQNQGKGGDGGLRKPRGKKRAKDIELSTISGLDWAEGNRVASLHRVREYARDRAEASAGWYRRHRKSKRGWARVIRLIAIVSIGFAGLIPPLAAAIVFDIDPDAPRFPLSIQLSLVPTILVGLAALLVSLDKFNGFSSGWVRYMLSETKIRSLLEDFELAWTGREVEWLSAEPDLEGCKAAVAFAHEFVVSIDRVVSEETQKWAQEFVATLAEIDKAVDEAGKIKSGSVKVKVTNDPVARVAIGYGQPRDCLGGVCVFTNQPAGAVRIVATGQVDGEAAGAQDIATVKADDIAEVQLTLLKLSPIPAQDESADEED